MVNRSNDLRQNNRKIILREILRQEQISRQEIIEKTGLAPSTVSSITKDILEEKIIRKSGQLNSQGTGRKTDLFMKNGDHAQILVINLTFESSKIAVVDLELTVRSESDIIIRDFTSESVAKTLLSEINIYLNNPKYLIQSIVLALPHYPYEKEQIKALLIKNLDRTVFTINNVEAMGMYDSQYLHSKSNSLVYIFIGKGIGSAFFHKGELLLGENGYASDLGHIHITDQAIKCRCGRLGCLETVASEDALMQSILDAGLLKEKLSADKFIKFLQKSIDNRDEETQKIIGEAASYLAESILTIISLLDPQAIIITGRITALNPFFSQKLEEYIYNKSGRRSLYANKIIYQKYRPKSTAKGAALYAFLSAYGGLNNKELI